MDCGDYRRLLSREIDGEIDSSQRTALEEHLAVCERCRKAREALRQVYALHSGLGELEPPRSLMRHVMDGVTVTRRRSRFAGLVRAAVPVAAAVVLVLGIYAGVFLTEVLEQPSVNQQLAALELEYLDEYPPESMGDLLMEVTEGGSDERGE